MIKPFMPERAFPEAPAVLHRADIKVVRALVRAAASGLVGALLVPLPVAAAPALCEHPERYAAQSGAQLLRINKLDLEPAGRRDEPITEVGVGDVKSALAAQSTPSAAAVGRILDAGATGREAITDVLRQTAPPSNDEPVRRSSKATGAGPFKLGRGELTMHARWAEGMACGRAAGDATRGQAGVRRMAVLEDGDTSLVRVPKRMSSLSTTAMERSGAGARTVAAATITGDTVELLAGAVVVKIVKPPSLLAGMSDQDGGEIRYVPAVIEVSGEGFESARLNTAGDAVEFNLDEDGTPTDNRADAAPADADTDKIGAGAAGPDAQTDPSQIDAAPTGSGRTSSDPASPKRTSEGPTGSGQPGSGQPGSDPTGEGHTRRADQAGAAKIGEGTADLGETGADSSSAGQTVVQEPPVVADREHPAGKTSQPLAGLTGADKAERGPDGTGDAGSELLDRLPTFSPLESGVPLPVPAVPGVPAVAERDTEAAPAGGPGTTIRVSLGEVRQASTGHAIAAKATAVAVAITQGPEEGDATRNGIVLDLGVGLLEVAAVAPEPPDAGAAGVGSSGGGGWLPITGPGVDVIALSGVALLIAGAAALIFGIRGRYRR